MKKGNIGSLGLWLKCLAILPFTSTSLMAEEDPDKMPLPQHVFAATHNSYAGGTVGTIPAQLERGIRFLEFDLYAENVSQAGDYTLGHDGPGEGVALGNGNPDAPLLSDWLEVVNRWSEKNPAHAPIFVVFDIKGGEVGSVLDCAAFQGGLSHKSSFADGNLSRLNAVLVKTFGTRLFRAEEFKGGWPALEAARGRVFAILSGDLCTRREYCGDVGSNPAVAMNAKGQIIEVHDSGLGKLWYWTGQLQDDHSVRWLRHGNYDTGKAAAVALSDDGWVVEVHEAEGGFKLFYQLGKLDADGEIEWFHKNNGIHYDQGARPSIRFVDQTKLTVRDVHRHQIFSKHFSINGTIDKQAKTINWDVSGSSTEEPFFDRAKAEVDERQVAVRSVESSPSQGGRLEYSVNNGTFTPIRYEQIALTELQRGEDPAWLSTGILVTAAKFSMKNLNWATAEQEAGRLVRLWEFDPKAAGDVRVCLPATDAPFDAAYDAYCTVQRAVR